MASSFSTGQRLSFSGALCTVRYVGTVQGTKGDWIGVEWDDPSKGKHSGEYGGVTYFECLSQQPHAGSFVRPTRPLDKPLGFLEALQKKYALQTAYLDGNAATDGIIQFNGKVVEEVGFDKISRQLATLEELRVVVLDELCLAGLECNPFSGDLNELTRHVERINETCPNITELDLSKNLLESWTDVAGICKALPHLKVLKANGNRFQSFSTLGLDTAFRNIKELHLDGTLITWSEIVSLVATFCELEVLSFSSNRLTDIPLSLSNPHLTTLNLAFNRLTALSSLQSLSTISNLRTLSLRANNVSTVSTPNTPVPLLSSISSLDLSYNSILTLKFITHLPAVFPFLTSLRISENPLYRAFRSPDDIYMLTVARIPTLTTLNFSSVSTAQRRNAEIYYLSEIGKQLSTVPADQEFAILKDEHPQYESLCALHSPPTINRNPISAIKIGAENTLASRLIEFTFHLANQDTVDKKIIQTLLLPKTITPYRLKSLVGPLFGLAPMLIRLIWETNEWDPIGGRKFERDYEKDDERRWSVSESSDSGSEIDVPKTRDGNDVQQRKQEKKTELHRPRAGKYARREVEIVDGLREVGFWIEEKTARIRVEKRARAW